MLRLEGRDQWGPDTSAGTPMVHINDRGSSNAGNKIIKKRKTVWTVMRIERH